MESLFNFLHARPLEAKTPGEDAILAKVSGPMAGDIVWAWGQSNVPKALRTAATRVVERRPPGGPSSRQLEYSAAAATFAQAVRKGTIDSVAEAKTALETAFGGTLADVAADPEFDALALQSADELAGIKYGGRLDLRAPRLIEVVRTCAYVERLFAAGAEAAPEPADWMSRVVVLQTPDRPPREIEARPPSDRPLERAAAEAELKALRDQRREIDAALAELVALPSERLFGLPEPQEIREGDPRERRERSLVEPGRVPPALTRAPLAATALEDLSAGARRVVEGLSRPRGGLLETLQKGEQRLRELGVGEMRLEEALAPNIRTVVIGGGVYTADFKTLADTGDHGEGAPGVPLTHGKIGSVGIGDLLVVRQALKGYEARELSHVDNVLKGEHRSLTTKRIRTTEETIVDERETTLEEERDQQSTERFEMQKEAAKVQKEDDSLKIGTSLSGSYGPVVEFKVTTDLGMSSSKEESAKSAESYGKEVTTRASSKVTERVLRRTTMRTLESFEEENIHEWNNVPGEGGHVVGQYQWLEKLYEAQVFNYGSRVLFDLVVPEPAAFIHYTLQTVPAPGEEIKKPPPFTLNASQITAGNYAQHAHRYDAEGIEAPPEPVITLSKVFEGVNGDADSGEIQKTAEVPIADGYEAVFASAVVAATYWGGWHHVVVTIGTAHWVHSGASVGASSTPLNKQQKSISCTLLTINVASVTAAIEITCNRTAGALEKWRNKTHQAIKQGYLKQMKAYEDAVERAKAQAVAQTRGRSPLAYSLLQREELKKAVISVFTAQHFDAFGAIQTGGLGLPQVDLAEAELEGPYIRFFEQAFEWEQMMFLYYPYYWGRKSRWVEASFIEDADFEFAAFMKAGAARVVVSVRPGFELAVAHFLETGQIWEGGDPPLVTSPAYLNIVDEIKDRQQAGDDELPVGDPWEVRLPTTLILLRKKDSLPRWEKNASGAWVDAT
ncbi:MULTISPECIES: hypothetical protein [unclassified Brevundimonas]|uniref:hypothetical protein n=1 Tax=unclassified Brevundimonas TaxID=2622653 RepID=UPI003F93E26D